MLTRQQFLERILSHVPFEGWAPPAIAAAARELGMAQEEALRLFPGGIGEIAAFFTQTQLETLDQHFGLGPIPERLSQRIPKALKLCFELAAPHREAIRRLQAYYALPLNIPDGVKALYRVSDHIWRLCQDHSTDFSFYTKRAVLASIYGSALLFWLNDRSEGGAKTSAFIDRQLMRHAEFHKLKSKLTKKFA